MSRVPLTAPLVPYLTYGSTMMCFISSAERCPDVSFTIVVTFAGVKYPAFDCDDVIRRARVSINRR